jgi:hypothetical protein
LATLAASSTEAAQTIAARIGILPSYQATRRPIQVANASADIG